MVRTGKTDERVNQVNVRRGDGVGERRACGTCGRSGEPGSVYPTGVGGVLEPAQDLSSQPRRESCMYSYVKCMCVDDMHV